MRNATPVLPFKTRRPARLHYFLRVNCRPFSFFTRAKIISASDTYFCKQKLVLRLTRWCGDILASGEQIHYFNF